MSGNTHKFAEDERAVVRLLLGDDKLHGRGVHAVTERRDNSKVSHGEERIKLVLLDSLVAGLLLST